MSTEESPVRDRPSRINYLARKSVSTACNLPVPLLCHRRRLDLVRARCRRSIPTRSQLCGSHPQRKKACQAAGRAIHKSRVGHQYEKRQGTRARGPAETARHRRRGNPIIEMSLRDGVNSDRPKVIPNLVSRKIWIEGHHLTKSRSQLKLESLINRYCADGGHLYRAIAPAQSGHRKRV